MKERSPARDLDHFRALAYSEGSVVLICYSVAKRSSFESVSSLPIILLAGLKSIRGDEATTKSSLLDREELLMRCPMKSRR